MFKTVTLNACFDLTLTLTQFSKSDVNRVTGDTTEPAGKGFSLARVLHTLGSPVESYIMLGEQDAARYAALAGNSAGKLHFVPVRGTIRENITLCTPEGIYKINRVAHDAPGSAPDPKQGLHILAKKLVSSLEPSSIVGISGSIPPEISKDDFLYFCKKISVAGARLAIDCDFLNLDDLREIKPFIIKPNEHEIVRMTGIDDQDEALKALANCDIAYILLSLGPQGLRLYSKACDIWAHVPDVPVLSTVVAGDSALAAFLHALNNGQDIHSALILAAATSTVTVTKTGSGIGTLQENLDMREHIVLT